MRVWCTLPTKGVREYKEQKMNYDLLSLLKTTLFCFFLFAHNIFCSFAFLLCGRHAPSVGSVEKTAQNHSVCLSMETVSQRGKKVCKLRKTENKLTVVRGGRIKHYEKKNLHYHFASFIPVLVFNGLDPVKGYHMPLLIMGQLQAL